MMMCAILKKIGELPLKKPLQGPPWPPGEVVLEAATRAVSTLLVPPKNPMKRCAGLANNTVWLHETDVCLCWSGG